MKLGTVSATSSWHDMKLGLTLCAEQISVNTDAKKNAEKNLALGNKGTSLDVCEEPTYWCRFWSTKNKNEYILYELLFLCWHYWGLLQWGCSRSVVK